MARSQELPEGYEVPLHRSLSQPMLWMGLPRSLFFLTVFAGIFGGIILKSFMAIGVAAAVYLMCRFLARYDKQFHQVFMANRYYKKFYYQ